MRIAPLLTILSVAALAGGGYVYWSSNQSSRVPDGFASSNGRIEVERIDITAKYAGRVAEILVREGDDVPKGAVVARLDDNETRARLLAARASVRRAEEAVVKAQAEQRIREAEFDLSKVELRRAVELERRSAGPVMDVDRRKAANAVAEATVKGAQATVADAEAAKQAAEAEVAQIEAVLAELTLAAPVAGRVEYKLVQPGEVVPAGGRLATLLDLTDVFMTVFLPTRQAGQLALGSEARIVLDAMPGYVFPATVTFVAAEAQFTPKSVETAEEREKLMYRVKLSGDPALLATFRRYVRAGLTGQAYVRLDPTVAWPETLAPRLPDVTN